MRRRWRTMDSSEPLAREFSSDELADIIRMAARHQSSRPSKNKVTYDEMLTVGRELGIDPSNLEEAAADISLRRQAKQRRIRRKMKFLHHLSVYASVIGGLFLLNMLTSPGKLWFLFPAVAWGIPVAIQGISIYLSEKEAMMREVA